MAPEGHTNRQIMTPEEYKQLQAFARIDGLYLGLVWIGSFACYIYGLTSPLTAMVGMIAAVVSPFYAAMRLKKFRDEVREGIISFARGMYYYIQIFMYGALLFAMAQWIYFQFLDNGYLADVYAATLATPEAETMIKAYGMTGAQVDEAMAAFRETSAIAIAANVLAMNIIIGIAISIPVALVMKRERK